jgi:ectoine hydroxylase-related dioxygenase (phytanoyl-CoA dioxygenase family)
MEKCMAPLSEADVRAFRAEGFVVARQLVPLDSIRAVLAAGEAHQALQLPGANFQAQIFDEKQPANDATTHALLREPRVYTAAAQLLGSAARVYYAFFAVVPGGGGRGLPWHQDNMYTKLHGAALNIHIALAETPPEQGVLWVGRRSHLEGVLPNRENTSFAKGHRDMPHRSPSARPQQHHRHHH